MAAARPVPVATSPLIGRAAELAALRGMFRAGPARLLTLTGPPGVGKTRLALECARQLADDFPDGVAWADLGPVRDPKLVPAELARAVGVAHLHEGMPVDAAATVLADRDVLLVVDNCEHLLEAAVDLRDLLERLPRLRMIATSRQRLGLRVETEVPVPPLAGPTAADADADDLARLAANPALSLLLGRAPSHVTLTRRTAADLVAICQQLDGLPLALELAAARLRVFTPSELAFRITHRSVRLTSRTRDVPARHRTLDAAIDWSHDLLPAAERAAFRRLAVLVGDWTLAAAQAVCGLSSAATLAAVESLLDQSLIHRAAADGSARFGMLASIRHFAAEQLVVSGELAAVRDRHARHVADVAEAWERTLATESENSTWSDLAVLHPDLSAALQHLAPGALRARVGVGLAWHGHLYGSLVQAPAVLDALHEIDDGPVPVDDDVRAALLVAAGLLGFDRGDFVRAERDLRSAIELCARSGDVRRKSIATSFLGHTVLARGHPEVAAACYRAARAMCERRGDVRGCAWSAYDLGLLAVDSADPQQRATAEPLLREALTYFADLDYDWAAAQAARGLASAVLLHDDTDEAARLLGRSLVLHDRSGDRRGLAQCLELLADVAARRGSAALAARLLGAARTQRRWGATTPTESEQRRLDALEVGLDGALGRVAVEHEKHNGRTSGHSAVLALALGVAEPGAAPASAVTLTARQLQVAELITAGRTNRQIAAVLGISEKTAEIHVSNILARLDVPSRAGVAAWVARRPEAAPSTAPT